MKNKFSVILLGIMVYCTIVKAQAPIDIQIGYGQWGSSSLDYPTPIQDRYEGSRMQFLYRASALNSFGMTKGIITAIKFYANYDLNLPGVVEQYTIKMGTTSATTMPTTSWLPSTITVFGPVDYQPNFLINTFTLATPFVWNGVDNIVLEFCNGDPNNANTNTYSYNSDIASTAVPYVCGHTTVAINQGNLCGTPVVTQYGQSNLRPNAIFTWQSNDSCLPVNVPYTENLEFAPDPYLPVCTSKETFGSNTWYVNDVSQNYPFFPNKTLTYGIGDRTIPADAWFYTRGIQLNVGISYRLTFNYGNITFNNSVEKMNVFYGAAASAGSMTNLIVNYPSISINDSASSVTDFTPVTSGVYFIGFHAYSDANQNALLVDNINVTLTPTTPVKLLSFTGEKVGTFNQLHWTTATEQNNKGFIIQRSADGENFSSLGFVGSKAPGGSSTANLSYVFDDGNPFSGTTYYRLKQMDYDGKSTLSNIVMLKGVKNTKLSISAFYPNPVQNKATLVVASPNNNEVQIMITDLAGKIVKQIPFRLLSGDNIILLKLEDLSKGTYVLKIVCNNGCEKAVSKFVKM